MVEISYPSVEEIIEFNILVLGLLKVKKADKHNVLSRQKIVVSLEKCGKAAGDIYLKGALLMRSLASAHAFASGNRRTAFVVAKDFVVRNGGKFLIPDDPHHAKVMRGIREGRYSDIEIAEWMKNGKIRQFER